MYNIVLEKHAQLKVSMFTSTPVETPRDVAACVKCGPNKSWVTQICFKTGMEDLGL